MGCMPIDIDGTLAGMGMPEGSFHPTPKSKNFGAHGRAPAGGKAASTMSFNTVMPIGRREKVVSEEEEFAYHIASENKAMKREGDKERSKLPDEDISFCSFLTCSKVASVRCSKCKVTRYCSAACQKKDWALGHRERCGLPPAPLLPPDSSDDEDFPKANRKPPEVFDMSPRKTSRGYLKIHESDNCKGLPVVFLSDPTAFAPRKEDGEQDFLRWGLHSSDIPVTQEWMSRKLSTGLSLYGDSDNVEVQFVKVLARKKKKALDLRRAENEDKDLGKSIYTLRVAVRVEPTPWRQLRVRGDEPLDAFAKLLLAALGWTPNKVAEKTSDGDWYFTDPADGACFGAPGAQSALEGHGFYHMDASSLTLSDLLGKPGARLRFCYDLKHGWDHEVYVDEVFGATGSMAADDAGEDVPDVLQGANACPPEASAGLDGRGNAAFAAFLHRYHPGGAPGGRNRDRVLNVLDEVRDAPNWDEDGVLEPTDFKLARARTRLFAATGQKVKRPNPVEPAQVDALVEDRKRPNPLNHPRFYEKRVCEPPAKIEAPPPPPPPEEPLPPPPPEEPLAGDEPIVEEVVPAAPEIRIDPRDPRCLNCGKQRNRDGHRPKRCLGCGDVHFCGTLCQKEAWPAHRKTCAGFNPPPKPKSSRLRAVAADPWTTIYAVFAFGCLSVGLLARYLLG